MGAAFTWCPAYSVSDVRFSTIPGAFHGKGLCGNGTTSSAIFAESLAVLRGALTAAVQCAVACWDLPGCGKTGGPLSGPMGERDTARCQLGVHLMSSRVYSRLIDAGPAVLLVRLLPSPRCVVLFAAARRGYLEPPSAGPFVHCWRSRNVRLLPVTSAPCSGCRCSTRRPCTGPGRWFATSGGGLGTCAAEPR